jgi:hypothetical protein
LTPDPRDNIVIQLKEITLEWEKIREVTAKPKKYEATLDWVRETPSEYDLPWEDAKVTQVKIQILILPNEYRRRGSMTFEIKAPNKSTLRNQDEARIGLARKYLKKWRIEHDKTIVRKVA